MNKGELPRKTWVITQFIPFTVRKQLSTGLGGWEDRPSWFAVVRQNWCALWCYQSMATPR